MIKTKINVLKLSSACIISSLFFLQTVIAEDLNTAKLTIFATLAKNGKPIANNIYWRVFAILKGDNSNKNNKINLKNFKEVQHSRDMKPIFNLAPGDYYVQCSFGRISAIKNIHIPAKKSINTSINLNAGALQMKAIVVNGAIKENKLNFAIYNDESENETYSLIDKLKKSNIVVPLKSGFYHLVSRYGNVNAIKRANVKVTAGEISQITFKHEAAQATLRLLRNVDGHALADTKWIIRDASGDIVFQTNGAYAIPILTRGNYVALAQNKKKLYQKDFSIESGKDITIDVLTTDKSHFKVNKSDALATD